MNYLKNIILVKKPDTKKVKKSPQATILKNNVKSCTHCPKPITYIISSNLNK